MTAMNAPPYTPAEAEKLFNDIKLLLENKPHDLILSVAGQIAGATLAQASTSKEDAYGRLFGRGAKAVLGKGSYCQFLTQQIDQRFTGLVLNSAEVGEQYNRIVRNGRAS